MSFRRPVKAAGSNARARFSAPGRWRTPGWSRGLFVVLLAGCTAVGTGSGGEPDPPGPSPAAPTAEEAAEARAAAILDEARARADEGAGAEALGLLWSLPPDTENQPALELAREVSTRLGLAELDAVLEDAPPGHVLTVPARVALATGLLLSGDPDGARAAARGALDSGASGADADHARSILDGRLPEGLGPFRLGALLPLTGSPALRTFASEVRDGMEAALVAAGLEGVVELEVLDTGGDASTAGALVRMAGEQGVLGIVGPLQDDALAAAAGARGGDLPLLSPTAYTVPQTGGGGVYSLGATDPGAAESLAAWAAEAGFREVAVLHASRGASAEEARIFSEAFRARGGEVLRTLVYEPGITYFQEQLRAVHGLRPEALFLPAPPEDVQALAPQVSFFGLDTLGVQVLGTAGWTDREILSGVGPRHLNGVVVATPRRPDATAPGYLRFVQAYEAHFRRSLVDPAVPALGFDAASLLLEAVRSGARTPAAVRQALEGVQGFAGATGILSFRDGRIAREHQMVCLWGGELVELARGQRPEPVFRPYPADPETLLVPEGPGRPSGFRCPGVAEPPPAG